VEEYLETYWGERWPQKKTEFAEWCSMIGELDCLEQVIESTPPPWEDVVLRFDEEITANSLVLDSAVEGVVSWPSADLTISDVRARSGVSDDVEISQSDLEDVKLIAAKYDLELRAHADVWRRDLTSAVQSMWMSGEFDRGPILLPPNRSSNSLHVSTFSIDGWCVVISVPRDRFPWIVEQLNLMASLRSARSSEIRQLLTSNH
jgi:hypothetical protein